MVLKVRERSWHYWLYRNSLNDPSILMRTCRPPQGLCQYARGVILGTIKLPLQVAFFALMLGVIAGIFYAIYWCMKIAVTDMVPAVAREVAGEPASFMWKFLLLLVASFLIWCCTPHAAKKSESIHLVQELVRSQWKRVCPSIEVVKE
jgi:hypothetical protein